MRRRTLCAASALAMMTPIPVSAFSFAEDEFDVVVAGAGGAGLAAALSAAEQGASVLLVEKMAAIGGNTLRASGLFNASDPARQEPMGITDSPSWHYEQTMASGHGRNDPAVVRRFVCEALPTLKWLEEALQKPLFPSRIEQNRSVRFFFTTSKNGVFLPSK